MQIIRDRTIRRKIVTGFALVLAVTSLQGWFAIRRLDAMNDSVGKIGRGELPAAAVSQLYQDSRVFILTLAVATVVAGLLLALFLARLIAHSIEQLGIATEQGRDRLARALDAHDGQEPAPDGRADHQLLAYGDLLAEEISANAKLITSGAQRQAQAAEEASTSMEQMAASIQTVAGNAQSLRRPTRSAGAPARTPAWVTGPWPRRWRG